MEEFIFLPLIASFSDDRPKIIQVDSGSDSWITLSGQTTSVHNTKIQLKWNEVGAGNG